MVKVTPHENLVPDTRDGWVNGHPFHDLVHNVLHARKLIKVAAQTFNVKKGAATFSGYVAPNQSWPFSIHLWNNGELVRSVKLRKLGYGGALHVETQGDLSDAVGWDADASLILEC